MRGLTRVGDPFWNALVWPVAVAIAAYVGVRAWVLSFTHDESISYTKYVREPVSSILLSRETDANNHPLNSLAMKLADHTFGPSEIALRSANVVAFVLYVAALVVLLRRVERRSIRVLGFSLAVANPYVLDFFSLARGYGLALALVAASALAAIEFAARPRLVTALAAVTCAGLAVLANFATLTYYTAVICVIALASVVHGRQPARSVSLPWLAVVVCLPTAGVALLVVRPLFRLRRNGALYFGGEDGFWRDTAQSLVSSTLYRRGSDVLVVALVLLVAAAVAAGAVAAALALRRRSLPPHAAALVLLVVPGLVSVAQHHVGHTLFLIERTALFFIPLLAIWLAFAADALARRPRLTSGVTAAAIAMTIATWINLATAVNFSYVLDWRYDATTERVLTELAGSGADPRAVDLGVSLLFAPATAFYRETRFGSLAECGKDCLDSRSDYYYLIGPDVETIRRRGARIVRVYSVSGAVLARDTRVTG